MWTDHLLPHTRAPGVLPFCLGNFCLGNFCLGNFCLGNFCLGNFCLGTFHSTEQRLQSWCRGLALWQFVDLHLKNVRWPVACPHPLCAVSLINGRDLRFCFIDVYDLSQVLPKTMKHSSTGVAPSSSPEENAVQKKKAPHIGRAFLGAAEGIALSPPSQESLSNDTDGRTNRVYPITDQRVHLLHFMDSMLTEASE
jgi:hypothetical protein